jgi:hypothetical protein
LRLSTPEHDLKKIVRDQKPAAVIASPQGDFTAGARRCREPSSHNLSAITIRCPEGSDTGRMDCRITSRTDD